MHDIISQFVTLWAVIDPVGSIPVFLAVTAGFSLAQQRKLAGAAVLAAAGVLLFFPLAIPSIASPGAMMAVVMLTDNHGFDLVEQSITTGLMLVVVLITLLLLLGATFIHRLIGDAGASINQSRHGFDPRRRRDQ
jgi:multiple antibiotic resistance protein